MKKLSILLNKYLYFFYVIIFMLLATNCYAASSDGFDFPAGVPDGDGYKNGSLPGPSDGWGFLEWNGSSFHPGEDWNRGWGSDDYGDPLFSIADGEVVDAKNYGGNWGKLVLIKHQYGNAFYWSQYAHLKDIKIVKGDFVERGDLIGSIGDAEGRWASHLHFEIRIDNLKANYWPSGKGKDAILEYYVNPTEFINANRPQAQQEEKITNLTNTPDILERNHKIGAGKVIWERFQAEQDHFPDRSTLYYHDLGTGENGEIGIGSFIDPIEGPHLTDINNDYFCYVGKDAPNEVSNIFCHNLETSADIQITDFIHNQTSPALSEDGYLVWHNAFEGLLYYTNIYKAPEINYVNLSAEYQNPANVWGNMAVYSGLLSDGNSYIFLSDLLTGEVNVISKKVQGKPDIWGEWISYQGVDGSLNIYNYITKEVVVISDSSYGDARISHGNIVWQSLNDGLYINVYNIESRENEVIDMKLRWNSNPYVYENMIAFGAPNDPLSNYTNSMDVWLAWF